MAAEDPRHSGCVPVPAVYAAYRMLGHQGRFIASFALRCSPPPTHTHSKELGAISSMPFCEFIVHVTGDHQVGRGGGPRQPGAVRQGHAGDIPKRRNAGGHAGNSWT